MKMPRLRLQIARLAALWIWLLGIATVVITASWISGRLGITSPGVSTRLQVVGVIVVSLTAMVKTGTWLYSRLQGTQDSPDVAKALTNAIAKREEISRAALLGGTVFADLSLATEPEKVPASASGGLRTLFANLIRYRSTSDGTVGAMSSIATLFNDLNPARLLILGEPGSGKTVLSMTLILKLLETGQNRIPVRLSIAAWDPETELDDWLVERLSVDYGMPLRSARSLVDLRPRKILPVLDGLDEMDNDPPDAATDWAPRRALAALSKLNNYYDGAQDGPVVLTCRKRRYEQICQAGDGLRFAKTVEIQPLNANQITEYLDKALTGVRDLPAGWQQVIDRIHTKPDDDLSAVLSTPWILHLVVSFADAGGDPARLLETARGGGSPARTRTP